MILHANGQKVTGVEIAPGEKCAKCGSSMVKRPCPCPFKRKGWATCAKCVNRRCGTVKGLKMRAR